MEATKGGFSENQVMEGFLDGTGVIDYNADVIAHLDTTEDVLGYAMLAPSSPEAQKLSFILYEIMNDRNISDKESDFLDSINSRFIGHSKKSDLTKREILCLFLNQYWDWSSPQWSNFRTVSISVKGLFSAYTQFCNDNSFGVNTRRLTRKEFSEYLGHYGRVKRVARIINGKKRDINVIDNLPIYKESLTEIPDFDLRKYFE